MLVVFLIILVLIIIFILVINLKRINILKIKILGMGLKHITKFYLMMILKILLQKTV